MKPSGMHVQKQIDHLLAVRASQWLEILKSGDATQRAAFVDWLRESRLHVQEFLEVVAVERELAGLDSKREEDVEALLRKIAPNVVELKESQRSASRSLPSPPRERKWRIAGTIAAGAAAVAILFSLFNESGQFKTRIGEQKEIELADTSVVKLNTDTTIEVALRDSARDIQLVHGEATFKVAHDPARPFRVHARAGVLQAVGTQFNVYDRSEGTRVSVLEGKVRAVSQSGLAALLSAGEEALLSPDGSITRSQHPDISHFIAWQRRQLIFDNATLEDVVHEFNRYNRSPQIRLENVPVRAYHYDGIFNANDPSSLANLLARDRELVVERSGEQIVIRPKISE